MFHKFIHDPLINFKITDLNSKILSHNFGPYTHAKPVLISDNYMEEKEYKYKKLPFTATEMLTFSRHILLLLAQLDNPIPDCEEMEVLKKLRNIISLTFNHNIQKEALPLMSIEIEDFLQSYINIGGLLVPKFHNLVHYSRVIKLMGPLQNIACFVFESAHQPLKKTAASSNNRINLPVTLHKKVEIKFCCNLINSEDLLRDINYTETTKKISDHLCSLYALQKPVLDISKLYYKGLRMQKSEVVQIGSGINDFPLLVLIKLIKKDASGFKLVVEDLQICNFNTDYHAYEVMYTNNFYTVDLDSIPINNTFVSCVSEVNSLFYVTWI